MGPTFQNEIEVEDTDEDEVEVEDEVSSAQEATRQA